MVAVPGLGSRRTMRRPLRAPGAGLRPLRAKRQALEEAEATRPEVLTQETAEALLRGPLQQRKAHMQQLVVAVEVNSRDETVPDPLAGPLGLRLLGSWPVELIGAPTEIAEEPSSFPPTTVARRPRAGWGPVRRFRS